MAVTPTYPGVYIDELPSGVRTINGVSTSVTAFLGRAIRGPANDPVTLDSFADFERIFGGVWGDSPMTYAVRDYFLNGGNRAVVVRLYKAAGDSAGTPAGVGKATVTVGKDAGALSLEARSPGAWGNNIDLRIEVPGGGTGMFDLKLRDATTGELEVFRNLSVDAASPRFVKRVLESDSQFVRMSGTAPTATPPASGLSTGATPTENWVDFTGGSDGQDLVSADYIGTATAKSGLYALDTVDSVNLLCVAQPKFGTEIDTSVWAEAARYCTARRAVLIVDPKESWCPSSGIIDRSTLLPAVSELSAAIGDNKKNAAFYYPRLRVTESGVTRSLPSCGTVAGVIARTDAQRGVWKSPAGVDASLIGATQLSVKLTDAENGDLNQNAINCLRNLPASGRVVWGARTLAGNDATPSDWKYLSVRRMALHIEQSLLRGTQWAVFESNDEPLWSQIRLNIGSFMNDLFRKGAFAGRSPKEAYFVLCDSTTTTASDINHGIVNIIVGFAPLKPAEFVVVKLQQIAGQVAA